MHHCQTNGDHFQKQYPTSGVVYALLSAEFFVGGQHARVELIFKVAG